MRPPRLTARPGAKASHGAVSTQVRPEIASISARGSHLAAAAGCGTLDHMTDASSAAPAATVVTVYPMTGRQLFFNVPHAICEECDLTIRLVQRVASDLPDVEVRIKPWFNHVFDALRRGGWHPPVVTINGKIATQGVVPDEADLRSALARAARPAPAGADEA